MKQIATLFIMMVILSGLTTVKAQTKKDPLTKYTVSGVIMDSVTKQPLQFANVGLLKESDKTFARGTTTDDKGNFQIQGVRAGSYFIRISFVGYSSELLPVKVEGDEKQIDVKTILVKPVTQSLNAVEVTAKKPIYSYNSDKKVYNVTEDVSVQSGVASDALQNAPGVEVDMEGNVTLRGVSNVEIWINDKPSRLSADGLKSYLQQLPANALERIEVITNPSAKYSASGTGGIINVITKQAIKKNFFLSLGAYGSTRPNASPWLSFMWSNEKWKFNLYATNGYYEWKSNSRSESLIKRDNIPLYSYREKSKSTSNNDWTYLYLNTEYQISKHTSIEVYGGSSYNSSKYSSNSETFKKDYFPQGTDSLDNILYHSDSKYFGLNNYYAGSSFTHNFNDKGHKLSVDLYGWGYVYKTHSNSSEIHSNESQTDKYRRTYPDYNTSSVVLNADYSYPINDSTSIEAGFNGSLPYVKSMNRIDSLNTSDSLWYFNELLSDRYKNQSKNFDAYLSYNGKLWGIGYKLGVRSEYKEYYMNSISMNRKFTRDFFSLYPSVHLSYATKSMNNFTLSYSRRVEYPDYQLNPFIDYSNAEGISGGNPDLNAAYTNSFEAGYAKYFKKGGSFSLSVYYRYTGKDITNITDAVYDTVLQRNTLFSSYTNSGSNSFTGGEITGNLRPAKFINITANANLYYLKIKADVAPMNLEPYKVRRENMSWDSKLSANFTIHKTIQWQVMGIYRSESKTVQGSTDPVYYINSSLRSDFFNRKLSINLGVQDLFDWQKTKGTTNTPTYSGSNNSKYITRYMTFGITLRFGKIEMEQETKTGQDKGGK